ncbi:MAG: hypothetical protein RLZZ241_761 [Bacteroidota bacterium]|jgi:hypothetical protein
MTSEISVGTRVLNGFLILMNVTLIGVLAAVIITLLLALAGVV